MGCTRRFRCVWVLHMVSSVRGVCSTSSILHLWVSLATLGYRVVYIYGYPASNGRLIMYAVTMDIRHPQHHSGDSLRKTLRFFFSTHSSSYTVLPFCEERRPSHCISIIRVHT